MSGFLDRIAGAPITWGVDPSPGWGFNLDPDRVLDEMTTVGLGATELGPEGFLPTDPDLLAAFLRPHSLRVVGGFVPAVLYRPDLIEGELEYVERACRQLAVSGSSVVVLGPANHHDGYDTSIEMVGDEWMEFLANLGRFREVAGKHGLETALHQHWGMAIERRPHVERLLEESDVGLCLDTGHFFLAGIDPVEIAGLASGRTHHVHLKDVDDAAAERVRSGEVGFRKAVIDGMFKPLGQGDVDIAGVIRLLETAGYSGWYVLEQDVSLPGEPEPGAGPIADAAASVDYLRRLARAE
ncbi:MAG: TIM barrel protein [Acidimicrobiia bacterium]